MFDFILGFVIGLVITEVVLFISLKLTKCSDWVYILTLPMLFISEGIQNIGKEIKLRYQMRNHYYILKGFGNDDKYYYCRPWKIFKVLNKKKLMRAVMPEEYQEYSKNGAYPMEVVKALNAIRI